MFADIFYTENMLFMVAFVIRNSYRKMPIHSSIKYKFICKERIQLYVTG